MHVVVKPTVRSHCLLLDICGGTFPVRYKYGLCLPAVYTSVHTFRLFRKKITLFLKIYTTTNQGNAFGQHKGYKTLVQLRSVVSA